MNQNRFIVTIESAFYASDFDIVRGDLCVMVFKRYHNNDKAYSGLVLIANFSSFIK